ncbi:hypothetical protein KIN34_14675 [Cellulomonas sp. DKR-3]|uniref:Uncharacterized protein n=1 Tax=Cellulomonas fulva TaxID=2835530 RepID=A0ABS5U2D6_9CELL|nr:hypothetical protein [Cellulomonas fulva]MBT0995527.1 hypothetical protein [Cellulomonas fulva]
MSDFAAQMRDLRATYRPRNAAPAWSGVAASAFDLAERAGEPDATRVEKDVSLLALVTSAVFPNSETVTLDELLSNETATDFDHWMGENDYADGTRRNHRAAHGRLGKAHRHQPLQRPRTRAGSRIDSMPGAEHLEEFHRLEGAARQSPSSDGHAWLTVVDEARAARLAGRPYVSWPDIAYRAAARRHAETNGSAPWGVRDISRAVVLEILTRPEPVAVLIDRYSLSREAVELGLGLGRTLPSTPDDAAAALLRGWARTR